MRAVWVVAIAAACGRVGFDAVVVGDGRAPGSDAPPPPCADPGFAAPQLYAGGQTPRAVAIGDVNGDGHLDIVGTDGAGSATYVYFGNGDGTFAAGAAAATGGEPFAVAIGDLDGDGKGDVVIANYGDDEITVDLSAGRSFDTPVVYATDAGPQSVAIGDVDGDGRPDLVVSCNGSNVVDVFHNDGGGAFTKSPSLPTAAEPYQTAIGDVDGDGIPDLVAACQSGSVSVLRGLGSGAFAAHVDITAGAQPWSVALGSVGGAVGAAIADNYGDSEVVMLHGAYPAWQTADVATAYQVWWVALADMTGDGEADVVAAQQHDSMRGGSDAVDLAVGNGDGTFQPAREFAACGGPVELAVGDLDGDGRPDVAVACATSGQLGVLLATCP